jgi:NADPH-dependent F420 reductase
MNTRATTIGVLGGTGAEGSGLAFRLAHAGHTVHIGSRDADKARRTAGELNALLDSRRVEGGTNLQVVQKCELLMLTVPYAAQLPTVLPLADALKGKILVDVTVPLRPPRVSRVQLPEGGSCVAELQAQLGEQVRVVAAFQNVGAHHLLDPHHALDCDVLVTADDKDARAAICALCTDIGLRGIEAGPLANSAAAEALTSVLIWINQRYKSSSAGIRITGLPHAGPANASNA